MNKVFIGGSRRISRISEAVRLRLNRIVAQRIPVVIGDASGADRAVQRYLHERGYDRVEVFTSSERPRNNIGGWPLQFIRPRHAARDFDYYATKDRAMAQEASVGLMIWTARAAAPF
jgi:adenine-specific DNA-methyltransferase